MLAEKLEKEIMKELESHDFALAKAEGIRSVPKIIAQRKEQRFVIKVTANIDAITEGEATVLGKIAKFLDSTPVIIGIRSQNGKLKKEVSYTRFSIECISAESIEYYLSSPKKYLASKNVSIKRSIDSTKLRQLRRIKNLTMKELAAALGVSQSTIYKYEHYSTFASDRIVRKLEDFFGEDLSANFTTPDEREKISDEKRLGKSELKSVVLNSVPFAIVAKGRNYYTIAGEADARTTAKRAAFFREITEKFSNIYPFFLGNSYGKIRGIPIVPKKQISELNSEEELLSLI